MSAEVGYPRAEFGVNSGEDEAEVLNGNVLFSADSLENLPVKPGRIIKKAKRLTKLSPKKEEGIPNGLTPTLEHSNHTRVAIAPFSKNSRKSRNAKGRGLPKKGGAGGKGVWGAPGSELLESGECSDTRDPNYDSDSQDTCVLRPVEPPLSSEEIAKAVEPILAEYLEHGDSTEVMELLRALNMGPNKHKVPEMAVSLAMDRHAPQREMTSRLISDLNGPVLSQHDMAKGFDELLENLSDLTLDTPEAPALLGQFIARAVADDCLPSNFITTYKGHVESPYLRWVRSALEKAEVLLSMNHNIAALDNIWGQGGGNRPVKYLTNKMVLLLKEYLSSGDTIEATRCLQELEVPHFHHELVYEAAVLAIEESNDRAADMVVQFLKQLTTTNIITPEQFSKGVKRVFEDMPEICLDVPAAYALLERLGNKLHTEAVLSDALMKELPVRGRKRFVSEGDGGKIKENGQSRQ